MFGVEKRVDVVGWLRGVRHWSEREKWTGRGSPAQRKSEMLVDGRRGCRRGHRGVMKGGKQASGGESGQGAHHSFAAQMPGWASDGRPGSGRSAALVRRDGAGAEGEWEVAKSELLDEGRRQETRRCQGAGGAVVVGGGSRRSRVEKETGDVRTARERDRTTGQAFSGGGQMAVIARRDLGTSHCSTPPEVSL